VAKFFFNFRQGTSYQTDELGCEFESVEDAYLGAFAAARDIWGELLSKREDPLCCAFEVMDEQGRDLFVLDFSEVLDACRAKDRKQVGRPHHHQQPFVKVLNRKRQAERVMAEVSTAVSDARATLREEPRLLGQVGRTIGD